MTDKPTMSPEEREFWRERAEPFERARREVRKLMGDPTEPFRAFALAVQAVKAGAVRPTTK